MDVDKISRHRYVDLKVKVVNNNTRSRTRRSELQAPPDLTSPYPPPPTPQPQKTPNNVPTHPHNPPLPVLPPPPTHPPHPPPPQPPPPLLNRNPLLRPRAYKRPLAPGPSPQRLRNQRRTHQRPGPARRTLPRIGARWRAPADDAGAESGPGVESESGGEERGDEWAEV